MSSTCLSGEFQVTGLTKLSLRASLFISVFGILLSSINGASLVVDVTGNSTEILNFTIPGSNELYLGQFDKPGKEEVVIVNKLDRDIEISDWRSPCPCLEINNMPEKIEARKTATISVIVSPEGYSGRIVKHMPITFQDRGESKVLFLPLSLVAGKEALQVSNETKHQELEYIDYNGGQINDNRYSGTVAWLFGSQNCPQCNYLKHFVFPVMFKPTDKVVVVNLDNREGFMVLFDLEHNLKISQPGQPPVLFFKGKIYYGSASIKKLLPEKAVRDLVFQ